MDSTADKRDGQLSSLTTEYVPWSTLGRVDIMSKFKEVHMSELDEFFGPSLPRLPSLPKRATFIVMSNDRVVIEQGRGRSKAFYGSEARAITNAYEKGQYRPQLPGRSRNGATIVRR